MDVQPCVGAKDITIKPVASASDVCFTADIYLVKVYKICFNITTDWVSCLRQGMFTLSGTPSATFVLRLM